MSTRTDRPSAHEDTSDVLLVLQCLPPGAREAACEAALGIEVDLLATHLRAAATALQRLRALRGAVTRRVGTMLPADDVLGAPVAETSVAGIAQLHLELGAAIGRMAATGASGTTTLVVEAMAMRRPAADGTEREESDQTEVLVAGHVENHMCGNEDGEAGMPHPERERLDDGVATVATTTNAGEAEQPCADKQSRREQNGMMAEMNGTINAERAQQQCRKGLNGVVFDKENDVGRQMEAASAQNDENISSNKRIKSGLVAVDRNRSREACDPSGLDLLHKTPTLPLKTPSAAPPAVTALNLPQYISQKAAAWLAYTHTIPAWPSAMCFPKLTKSLAALARLLAKIHVDVAHNDAFRTWATGAPSSMQPIRDLVSKCIVIVETSGKTFSLIPVARLLSTTLESPKNHILHQELQSAKLRVESLRGELYGTLLRVPSSDVDWNGPTAGAFSNCLQFFDAAEREPPADAAFLKIVNDVSVSIPSANYTLPEVAMTVLIVRMLTSVCIKIMQFRHVAEVLDLIVTLRDRLRDNRSVIARRQTDTLMLRQLKQSTGYIHHKLADKHAAGENTPALDLDRTVGQVYRTYLRQWQK